jgi:hypothetical protein
VIQQALEAYQGYTGEEAGKAVKTSLRFPTRVLGPKGEVDLRKLLKGHSVVLTDGGPVAFFGRVIINDDGQPTIAVHSTDAKNPPHLAVDPNEPDGIYLIGGNMRLSSKGELRGYIDGKVEEEYTGPRAAFIGYQEQLEGSPVALFNILDRKHPRYGSTVTAATLTKLGIPVPSTEIGTVSNPSWVQDEEVWTRARKEATKHRDPEHGNYWPLVTTFYKQMGGRIRPGTSEI